MSGHPERAAEDRALEAAVIEGLREAATAVCGLCAEAERGNPNFAPATHVEGMGWRHVLGYRGREGHTDGCAADGIHRMIDNRRARTTTTTEGEP